MTGRRIIYVLEPFPRPHGGVAIIYRHVEILSARGFSAFVHLPEAPETDFYDTTAQLLIGNLTLNTSDVLIIPETLEWALKHFRALPLRRLLFCQNHHYLPPAANPVEALAEWGVHGVIASSKAIQAHFARRHGLSNVPLVPCAIDPDRFHTFGTKKRQVAFMPRKLPKDAAAIQTNFRRRYRRYADVPWVPIDGMTQIEAAQILRESSVFLALGIQESLGLPPLEAMASGCLVAGYHGDGGREYASELNGWWAENGDLEACVEGLAAAFDLLDRDDLQLQVRRDAMSQTVACYSPQRMEEALLNFWRAEVENKA